MRRIATDFFAESPVLFFPLLALVVFVAIFAGACVIAARMPATEAKRHARLPLAEEER